jgi:hypothetical protein
MSQFEVERFPGRIIKDSEFRSSAALCEILKQINADAMQVNQIATATKQASTTSEADHPTRNSPWSPGQR